MQNFITEPIVSVIVPVYNVEQYLAKCLDSVINQTYKNLEIICVNDCSPDNSFEILKEYAQKDNRIKIVNREKNGGLSAARNSGLDIATGEYVYFIDSDDWIEQKYIEELVQAIETDNVDVVINANIKKDVLSQNISSDLFLDAKDFISPKGQIINAIDTFNNPHMVRWAVWARLYKKYIIDKYNIRFPEGYIHEDIYFQHFYMHYATKAYIYYGSPYHYIIRDDSITTTGIKQKKYINAHVQIWELVISLYKKNNWFKNNKFKLFEFINLYNLDDRENYKIVKNFFEKNKDEIKEQFNLYNIFEKFIVDTVLESFNFENYMAMYQKKYRLAFIRNFMQEKKYKEQIAVSIVIPVHNSMQYLQRCIESVCKQTLFNIEIILVDDFSTDMSLDLIKEYAYKDKRIKYIEFKEHKGVSLARNEGIKVARGEYIGFVDSDDFIDLDFYEKLYNSAKKTGADIVKGNLRYIDENDNTLNDFKNLNDMIRENKFNFNCNFSSAIYKTSLIKDKQILFQPDLSCGEDRLFQLIALLNSNKIETIDDVYYNYIKHANSLTTNNDDIFTKNKDRIAVLTILLSELNKFDLSKENYTLLFNELFIQIIESLRLYQDITQKLYNNIVQLLKFANANKLPKCFEQLLKTEELFEANIHKTLIKYVNLNLLEKIRNKK